MYKPRPAQEKILRYRRGTMGVTAVPGSGKTWTLSALASTLITPDILKEGQQLLIVTVVNSAVDNFRARIGGMLKEKGLIPGFGYQVTTLHSLAHEIVASNPSQVGLGEDFSIVDERITESLLAGAFQTSLPRHIDELKSLLSDEIQPQDRRNKLKRDFPALLQRAMTPAVGYLKNKPVSVQTLNGKVDADSPVLARLAADVFARYQHGLDTQGALDFDDLIVKALGLLRQDNHLLQRCRERWPIILEDEAQDSSALQEEILRELVGPKGGWVRVGDPNQAIYETFTTANPRYLRAFLKESDVARDLPNSGRSGLPIIEVANRLIEWVQNEHPVEAVRDALQPPLILPTPADDIQQNPAAEACRIVFFEKNESPEKEIDNLIKSLSAWLPIHQEDTVAVLVPTNPVAGRIVRRLQKEDLPFTDALLRLTTSTKETAGALCQILRHLADPTSPKQLCILYPIWYHLVLGMERNKEATALTKRHQKLLEGCTNIESFLQPRLGKDWIETLDTSVSAETKTLFEVFRHQVQQWHRLVLLPVGELITSLGQDLFREQDKLAMTQLFGSILEQRSKYYLSVRHTPTTLMALQEELAVIARDARKLRSIEAEKSGFDPESHRGEVVVATNHGAKGLEWDRVYLLSVNDYDYPSGLPGDQFVSEKWYIRDRLNLSAETLAQLDAVLDGIPYIEGEATKTSRLDYARERLRLLYVGITRARKELIVTSNNGRFGNNRPSEAFKALQTYLQTHRDNG